jgi:hypothetical protein
MQPETLTTDNSMATDSAAAMLYDADAEQRIPVTKEFNGELIVVNFVLGPQDDECLKQYDRLCDRRLEEVEADEAGEQNAMTSRDRSDDAAKWLFDDRAVSVQGMGDEGQDLPPDWKQMIDASDKIAVIDQGYLATGEVPKPPAKPGKRLPWNYRTAGAAKVIHLRAIFDGFEWVLTHTRTAAPSAEQMAEFKSLQSSAVSVGGKRLGQRELLILAKSGRYGALYDSIGYQTDGYKGRVPLHHKRKVVEIDLAGDAKVIAKKPNDLAS